MSEVTSFDSIDGMFELIEAAQQRNDQAVKPWQLALTYGDRFARWEPSIAGFIYMEITRSRYPEDWHLEERLFESNRRPVEAYSHVCTEGELGTVHVAVALCKVSAHAWAALMALGWPQSVSYELQADRPVFRLDRIDGVPYLDVCNKEPFDWNDVTIVARSTPAEPRCKGCGKEPSEITEYVSCAKDEGISPADYLRREEGTYNASTGQFWCTECYCKAGMPLGKA